MKQTASSLFTIRVLLFFAMSSSISAQKDISRVERSLDAIVTDSIMPHLEDLFQKLDTEELDFELAGVRIFEDPHFFLPGKIAIGFSYLLTETSPDDPKFAGYLAGYRKFSELTVDLECSKWGDYYYLLALYNLSQAGLMEQAISTEILEKLKQDLDYQDFVDVSSFTLIGKLPTNYYGVAFSIARLRFKLGWESEVASEILYDRMISHYTEYSGEFGFSDETNGQGRFDRYSILLVAEICDRLLSTDGEVPPFLKDALRKSVDFLLPLMNSEGHGLQYSRSLGPYGESLFIEVLSTAATLGMLDSREMEMAYAFQTRVSERLMNFWYDSEMGSINLWKKGRRTDTYRSERRSLGENLSIAHQHLATHKLWRKLNYSHRLPSDQFEHWLQNLPSYNLTWFSKGEFERAHLLIRDRSHLIELPMVSGGDYFHSFSCYYPIPFSADMLQGVPYHSFPQLLPLITLSDGSRLAPAVFIQNIQVEEEGASLIVTYDQPFMDTFTEGQMSPLPNDQFSVKTTLRFSSGSISRTDRFTPKGSIPNVGIEVEFAGFSTNASIKEHRVTFASGIVNSFQTVGYDNTTVSGTSGDHLYKSNTGEMKTVIHSTVDFEEISAPFTLSWSLSYQN